GHQPGESRHFNEPASGAERSTGAAAWGRARMTPHHGPYARPVARLVWRGTRCRSSRCWPGTSEVASGTGRGAGGSGWVAVTAVLTSAVSAAWRVVHACPTGTTPTRPASALSGPSGEDASKYLGA